MLSEDEILPEYSLAGGVRGKYIQRQARGTNLVLPAVHLAERDPDSAVLIPDAGEVPVEPHENKKIDLQKAVSAHEQAEAAIVDLINVSSDPRFEGMLERIRANLDVLRSEAATTDSNPAAQT